MPGGQRSASTNSDVKRSSGRGAMRSPRPGPRAVLLGSVLCTSTGVPVAAICYGSPRWLTVLALVVLTLSGMVVAGIAAVMPQESRDRLNWWREWLGHRERMAAHQGVRRQTGQSPREKGATGETCRSFPHRREPRVTGPRVMPPARSCPAAQTPVAEELVPE